MTVPQCFPNGNGIRRAGLRLCCWLIHILPVIAVVMILINLLFQCSEKEAEKMGLEEKDFKQELGITEGKCATP
jgi:hypothetical protein